MPEGPLRDPAECRYDVVALGEVMLRLDPGDGRIATTRSFRVWEGGGAKGVSDLNYRPSLWQAVGGQARAQEVNRCLVELVDVLIGNEEDFTAALGFTVPGLDERFTDLDTAGFQAMIGQVTDRYRDVQVIATTLRGVHSASVNDWGAIAWSRDSGFVRSTRRARLEILDRVGGGDSFASGLLYALLQGKDLAAAVEYGAAHGALAMTTPGDTSMATLAEVEALVRGAGARVQR
jgi:2-dehydro-3-deoxygluconokinase